MNPFEQVQPIPFDWSLYTGNTSWLPTRTIYVTRHGSHAYGTNSATSDLDLRGIVIPPREYWYGNVNRFEQTQNGPGADPNLDIVFFGVRKFFQIAVECNPNALELIFTDPSDHLLLTPLAEKLISNREMFLTQRALHTFSGYAFAQLKRIRGHYRWLKEPPTSPPTRASMGLPERTLIPKDQLQAANAAITKKLDQWNFVGLEDVSPDVRIGLQGIMAELLAEIQVSSDDTWKNAARTLGYSDNFIELLDIERRYTGKKREWEQYQEWIKNRNEKRAALEAKFGYDTKHAMHLVRLLRMCREILTEGVLRVRRPDAAELLAIRDGAWTYEQLIAWAEAENLGLKEITSNLPPDPPRAKIDALLIEIVEAGLY